MSVRLAGIALWVTVLLVPTYSQSQAAEHGDGAAKFVSSLAERAMATLAEMDAASGDRQERFRELFNDAIAVTGIGKFVLGRHWRAATPEERAENLVLFEDQIVGTWADRFSDYSGNQFQIKKSKAVKSLSPNENVAIVESTFWTGPNSTIRVDWRVSSNDTVYKITDIYVEGVSLANTHRAEFASAIRRYGGTVEGLLRAMRDRRDGIIRPTFP